MRLKLAGLKVTPQRLAVLSVLITENHPTADQITRRVKQDHPGIAIGTIYKILDIFIEKGIINKIETPSDVMKYDAITEHHHHLQDESGNRIEDYFDEDLNSIVLDYIAKKKIPEFDVKRIKIRIIGDFKNQNNNEK